MAEDVLGVDPCVRPKPATRTTANLPLLLPHEVVHCLLQHNSLAALQTTEFMAPNTFTNMCSVADELRVPHSEVLGLGLWGDGITSKWDRTESLEVLIMNIPGLGGPGQDLRVPLCALSKHFVVKTATMDAILAVVAWFGADPYTDTFTPLKSCEGRCFGTPKATARFQEKSCEVPGGVEVACEVSREIVRGIGSTTNGVRAHSQRTTDIFTRQRTADRLLNCRERCRLRHRNPRRFPRCSLRRAHCLRCEPTHPP